MSATGKRKNAVFHALKAALGSSVKPTLFALGFRPYKSKAAFPERFFRKREDAIDVIEFQFDKYASPAFRIYFRPITDGDDLDIVAKDSEEMWRWGAGYVANPTESRYGWFKVGLLERFVSPRKGIDRVCKLTKLRILEIDEFLRGGEPSPNISEKLTWRDPVAAAIGRKPPARRIQR